MSDNFVAYVGSWEIHDAIIHRVESIEDTVTVFLKAYEGHEFAVRFYGVAYQEAHEAEGMMLYSLSEMSWTAPLRKFNFVHWDEEASGRLEIIAEGFDMLDMASITAKDGTL